MLEFYNAKLLSSKIHKSQHVITDAKLVLEHFIINVYHVLRVIIEFIILMNSHVIVFLAILNKELHIVPQQLDKHILVISHV